MPKSLADLVRAALTEVREISPDAALELLDPPDRGGYEIIAVREADEFAAGHLPGARHFPRGGHRSALAAQSLQQMGFTRVLPMAEGWRGWTERGCPVEK